MFSLFDMQKANNNFPRVILYLPEQKILANFLHNKKFKSINTMNKEPRIYADFNKLDEKKRVILTCIRTKQDIARLGISFVDGMSVILYMPDCDENGISDPLEVDAVIRHDDNNDWWVGEFLWDELDHVSRKKRA